MWDKTLLSEDKENNVFSILLLYNKEGGGGDYQFCYIQFMFPFFVVVVVFSDKWKI